MLDPINFSVLKLTDCLSESALAEVESASDSKNYKKGVTIERQGDVATHLYLIKSGLVRLRLNEADGSRFNLSIFGAGSTFGETAMFLELPVQFDAYCETDVHLIQIAKDAMASLTEKTPSFSRALNKVANARVHTMLNYIGASLSTPLETRVAKFVASMARETADKKTIHCRQSDLAHALGVSRVSMGKSLKALEKKGLIKLGYGQITVPSIKQLSKR